MKRSGIAGVDGETHASFSHAHTLRIIFFGYNLSYFCVENCMFPLSGGSSDQVPPGWVRQEYPQLLDRSSPPSDLRWTWQAHRSHLLDLAPWSLSSLKVLWLVAFAHLFLRLGARPVLGWFPPTPLRSPPPSGNTGRTVRVCGMTGRTHRRKEALGLLPVYLSSAKFPSCFV